MPTCCVLESILSLSERSYLFLEKNIAELSSAELALRVLKVKPKGI